MVLPQPTTEATKEHFRNRNPRCLVRDIDAGIWVYPPYRMYDESFRRSMHELGATWNGEMKRWELAPRSDSGEIAHGIVERAFALGWDVELETFHGGPPPLKEVRPGAWAFVHSVWYEHPEDYYANSIY